MNKPFSSLNKACRMKPQWLHIPRKKSSQLHSVALPYCIAKLHSNSLFLNALFTLYRQTELPSLLLAKLSSLLKRYFSRTSSESFFHVLFAQYNDFFYYHSAHKAISSGQNWRAPLNFLVVYCNSNTRIDDIRAMFR